MKNSIKRELAQHLLDKINDGILTNENKDDWHFYAFNEDFYIIGYHYCSQWLKKHDIDEFEAIELICEYEKDNFGESNFTKGKINSETVVNMLTYIWGGELLNEFECETVEELEELCINLKN